MYYLGIDFGTSGARSVLINQEQEVCDAQQVRFPAVIKPQKLASIWRNTLFLLISLIPQELRRKINRIAINGTSSTVLLCDRQGQLLTEPLLYNDARGHVFLDEIRAIAPHNHVVLSASSSLAKLWWWSKQPYFTKAAYVLHQADWLSYLLHGKLGFSDYHNALKLGYDVEKLCYPQWLTNLKFQVVYPQVVTPGTLLGQVSSVNCRKYGLSSHCHVVAGTTDSIAAFLASGAKLPGDAVTSLGSTLVLKLLSRVPVTAVDYGIYSHRLGNLWLAGGASNTGGAVLQHFFSEKQLNELSSQIDPQVASPYTYYPLLVSGERFPINNPEMLPQLNPKPKADHEFLHGLLESMARIESQGYEKLKLLGADAPQKVFTSGGGSQNNIWSAIRQRYLQVPIMRAGDDRAAFGSSLLAAGQFSLFP